MMMHTRDKISKSDIRSSFSISRLIGKQRLPISIREYERSTVHRYGSAIGNISWKSDEGKEQLEEKAVRCYFIDRGTADERSASFLV